MPLPSDLVIGAVLALSGVLFAQFVAMLQSWLDRRNKREILLRTKYEEFAQHFLASIETPGRLLSCTTDEEIHAVTHQTDANQAALLALIYFPELREPMQRYVESFQNLCLIASELYYAKPQVKSVGLVVHSLPAYQAASQAHMAERHNVANKIESYAPKYAKS